MRGSVMAYFYITRCFLQFINMTDFTFMIKDSISFLTMSIVLPFVCFLCLTQTG
jgi:hypothetical protein